MARHALAELLLEDVRPTRSPDRRRRRVRRQPRPCSGSVSEIGPAGCGLVDRVRAVFTQRTAPDGIGRRQGRPRGAGISRVRSSSGTGNPSGAGGCNDSATLAHESGPELFTQVRQETVPAERRPGRPAAQLRRRNRCPCRWMRSRSQSLSGRTRRGGTARQIAAAPQSRRAAIRRTGPRTGCPACTSGSSRSRRSSSGCPAGTLRVVGGVSRKERLRTARSTPPAGRPRAGRRTAAPAPARSAARCAGCTSPRPPRRG